MKLICATGRCEVQMTQAIDAIDLADRFDATYVARGVVTCCRNRFEAVEDG